MQVGLNGSPNAEASSGLLHKLVVAKDEAAGRSPFEWLHFCMRHDGVDAHLRESLRLPAFIVSAMTASETRSRIIVREEGMMVLFKAMHQHDGANPEMMVSLRLWIEPHRIVSAREHDIDAVLTLRDELTRGEGPTSTADFLVDMIGHVYDEFDPLVDKMEEEIDQIETFVEQEITEAICGRLSALERRAAIFERHLAPQSAIFQRIRSGHAAFVTEQDKDHLNELDSRLHGMLETLRDLRARSAIANRRIQRIEEFRQTKASLVFASAATLFLPATFLTGLFGGNVGGIPWLQHPWGFVFLTLTCLSVMLASSLLIKRMRWL